MAEVTSQGPWARFSPQKRLLGLQQRCFCCLLCISWGYCKNGRFQIKIRHRVPLRRLGVLAHGPGLPSAELRFPPGWGGGCSAGRPSSCFLLPQHPLASVWDPGRQPRETTAPSPSARRPSGRSGEHQLSEGPGHFSLKGVFWTVLALPVEASSLSCSSCSREQTQGPSPQVLMAGDTGVGNDVRDPGGACQRRAVSAGLRGQG